MIKTILIKWYSNGSLLYKHTAQGGYNFKPDQIEVINPLLVLTVIPIFEFVLYPFLRYCKINFSPLRKMTAGFIFTGVSFLVAGFLQIAIDVSFFDPLLFNNVFSADLCLNSVFFWLSHSLSELISKCFLNFKLNKSVVGFRTNWVFAKFFAWTFATRSFSSLVTRSHLRKSKNFKMRMHSTAKISKIHFGHFNKPKSCNYKDW